MTNFWLMKSEPNCYSIDDLINADKQTHCWDGVRNYQARNFMRDSMQINDKIFFYHSSCKTPGIVGIAEVASKPYPDYTAQDPKGDHFDCKSTIDNPIWYMVDVHFLTKFPHIISLTTLKKHPELSDFKLLQKGNRLSILPVSKYQWDIILDIAEIL